LCGFCVCICAGVEHLLRNVKDATISTLASDVSAKLQALKGLKTRLSDVQVRYWNFVCQVWLRVHAVSQFLKDVVRSLALCWLATHANAASGACKQTRQGCCLNCSVCFPRLILIAAV
jgi:hypothetical protein